MSHHHPAAVTYLLEAGADLEKQDSIGWTALQIATGLPDGSTIAELLVQAGANVHSLNKDGWVDRERLRGG